MDIFGEMFATGGNIGPNRELKLPPGRAASRLELLCQGESFMANNEYIFYPVMESGAGIILRVCVHMTSSAADPATEAHKHTHTHTNTHTHTHTPFR